MIRDPQIANGTKGPSFESTFAYKVGDTGPGGGVIFFVDRFNEYTGFTYLERRLDLDFALPTWSVYTGYPEFPGAYKKGLGGGYQNTIDIINEASVDDDSTNNAAIYCDSKTLGGQSDWYLPSLAEMKLIDEVDTNFGFNSLLEGEYWTSTQKNGWQAFIYQADKIPTDLFFPKYIGLYVVFVRRF